MEIELDHFKMFYQEQGTGLPVILIHGFPLDHTIWDAVALPVAREARVITPDLRGHGQSQSTQGTYGMPDLADDIRQLLDRLEIERAVLVGHSMGGYLSLAFARAFPDRLAGLGLVATQAMVDIPERRKARYEMAEEVSSRGLAFLADSLPRKYTGVERHHTPIREMILNTSVEGVIGSVIGMAERVDSSGYLAEIDVPALVAYGVQDELIPPQKALDMCRRLPQAECLRIAGGWHMLMMEEPQTLAEGLIRLVRQVRGPTQ